MGRCMASWQVSSLGAAITERRRFGRGATRQIDGQFLAVLLLLRRSTRQWPAERLIEQPPIHVIAAFDQLCVDRRAPVSSCLQRRGSPPAAPTRPAQSSRQKAQPTTRAALQHSVPASATVCPGRGTARSTVSCTSWPWSSSATSPKAAPISTAKSPPARPRWRRCAPSTSAVRHRLPPDDPRHPGMGNGPGRTRGGGYWLQRGRLSPQHRLFRQVTSRTRHQRPYACTSQPGDPFPPPPASAGPQPPSSALCLTAAEDRSTLAKAGNGPS
jgi:hypothetical protein